MDITLARTIFGAWRGVALYNSLQYSNVAEGIVLLAPMLSLTKVAEQKRVEAESAALRAWREGTAARGRRVACVVAPVSPGKVLF